MRELSLLAPQLLKRTGFLKREPDSLYRRDSPWIGSYHLQNSFQLHISVILQDKTPQGFNYYIIQQIVVQILLIYKPIGLKGNKQKAEAVARLLGILHLDFLPPQSNLSKTWTVCSSSINVVIDLRVGSCLYQTIPKDEIC